MDGPAENWSGPMGDAQAAYGPTKNVTISRQGEMYFASVMTEREVSDPVHIAPMSSIGIDVGTQQDWTASPGHVFNVLGLNPRSSALQGRAKSQLR
jgi:hypothetical protein